MSVALASRPNTDCYADTDRFVQFLKNDVMQQALVRNYLSVPMNFIWNKKKKAMDRGDTERAMELNKKRRGT